MKWWFQLWKEKFVAFRSGLCDPYYLLCIPFSYVFSTKSLILLLILQFNLLLRDCCNFLVRNFLNIAAVDGISTSSHRLSPWYSFLMQKRVSDPLITTSCKLWPSQRPFEGINSSKFWQSKDGLEQHCFWWLVEILKYIVVT